MKKILSVSVVAIGLIVASGGDASATSISINFGDAGRYYKPVSSYYYYPAPVYYSYYEPVYYKTPKKYYKKRRKSYISDRRDYRNYEKRR